MENILSHLIMNWDQTAINLVPSSPWTKETKGKKRVEINGLNDKQQITAVFCGTMEGHFLPLQLIYGGKTQRCHLVYDFPDDWCVTHNDNHWSNKEIWFNIFKILLFHMLQVFEKC